VGELEDLCEPLQAALDLHRLVQTGIKLCKAFEGLPLPAWHKVGEIETYAKILECIDSERNLEQSKAPFINTDHLFRTALTNPDVHPAIREGHRALMERDEQAYGLFYANILALDTDRQRLERRKDLETRLCLAGPAVFSYLVNPGFLKTAEDFARERDYMANETSKVSWKQSLSHFTDWWRWAQANTWLEDYIAGTTEGQVSHEIREVQNRINVTTGRLAAALAWGNCFNRLTEKERQHLIAWKQAMRRIGKGTGKYAEKHRREAREHIEGCRGAIPAWIMPLYRVAESLKPAPNTYDVVIIDEASQAGPDALFLQYIAKKIVVVGDDMQISPDSIGVPREDVDLLRDRHIKDFPLPLFGALGVEETSFFHLAEVLFGGRIILREHFRCMPEIIQFSNDLCYKSTPLIPLRQYPPNRLCPVVISQPVPNGYREGSTKTPRNPSEAQAIVDEIARCCEDPTYDGKTIGVISLLGDYQTHLVRQKLIQTIGPEEIERRNLVCGDAYAFQGDERDIIFLSLVAAPDETGMRALTDQKSMRRFNVAASRARDQMWLFHTPTINDFRNKECLRYRLLNYCLNPKRQSSSIEGVDIEQLKSDARTVKRTRDNHPPPFDSWFEVDVFLKIADQGYHIVPQFEVAGYFIDLVVEGMRGRLAVECDGDEWHGPERFDADMMRQRTLERSEWTFWRIRGSEFYHNPELAMASLWDLLKKLRIAPGGQDIETTQNHAETTNRNMTDSQGTDEDLYNNEPGTGTETSGEGIKQQDFFRSQPSGFEEISRSEMLEALLAVIPPQDKMLRGDAIRAAAKLLKSKGRIEFQRVRENGEIWNEFKSVINSAFRRGLINGDTKSIWRKI
jgi:very-short-patch-repair endonuclease